MGGHAPHGQHNASDARFVAGPGKAEQRKEAERPPALRAPPRPHSRRKRHTPPPPPQPAPRHKNVMDPPRGAQPPQGQSRAPTPARPCPQRGPRQPTQWTGSRGRRSARPQTPHATVEGTPPGTPCRRPHNAKPSRGELGPDRPPPSTPDGARDRGRTRGGARTTWNGTTSAQCRDHARCARHTTQRGGERTTRERERTHTKGTRGDYRKGNRTERAERTDRMEWRTSERG